MHYKWYIIHSITSHSFDTQLHFNLCNLSCFRLKGFGNKDDGTGGYHYPNILQEVELKYVTDADCKAAWSPLGLSIEPSMMCASNTGKAACFGDDGNALFDAIENVLVGVISFGFFDGSVPVIFSRIANQWQWTWIQTTICAVPITRIQNRIFAQNHPLRIHHQENVPLVPQKSRQTFVCSFVRPLLLSFEKKNIHAAVATTFGTYYRTDDSNVWSLSIIIVFSRKSEFSSNMECPYFGET